MIKQGLNLLFPTPVLLEKMVDQDLNQRMAMELIMLKPSSGMPDTENLFSTNNEVILEFKEKIVKPAFDIYLQKVYGYSLKNYPECRFTAWVTGWSSGYNMRLHNHAGSEFSSVFYVMSEETAAGGQIGFLDPRSNANRGYDLKLRKLHNDVEYMPVTGEYLVFPSYLYHHVLPYFSSLRIAVPVDVFLGPFSN